MRVNWYQIVVLPRAEEQGGGYFVTVPQLPGCVAEGTSREEAVRYTEFAIEAWIAMVRDIGGDIPEPSPPGVTVRSNSKPITPEG